MKINYSFYKNSYKSLLDLDSDICLKVNGLSGRRFLDKTLFVISKLGDGYVYFIFLFAIIFVFKRPFVSTFSVYAINSAFNLIVYKIVKKKVKRKRPFNSLQNVSKLISPPDEFSFPSGHSSAAAVFCLCTFYYFPTPIFIITLIWTLIVGFSRVYNGVHYPGDVVVGYIMGFSFPRVSLTLIELFTNLIDRI